MWKSIGDVGSVKRFWNLRMISTSLVAMKTSDKVLRMRLLGDIICGTASPFSYVDKFAAEWDQIHWRQYNKRNFSMAKVRTTITPVRPCVTFHDLAEWAKQPRECLRV